MHEKTVFNNFSKVPFRISDLIHIFFYLQYLFAYYKNCTISTFNTHRDKDSKTKMVNYHKRIDKKINKNRPNLFGDEEKG